MRRLLLLVLIGFVALSPAVASGVRAAEPEPGSFTFRWENERAWLHADDAPVNAILKEISEVTGIPIQIDESDEATLTVELEEMTLEKLIRRMSSGYALIYRRDLDDGRFILERIVAASDADALHVEVQEEAELDESAVVREIVERTRKAERYHQKMVTSMNMMGRQMEVPTEMWIDGDRYRMEMTVPPGNMKQIIVSDGEIMHTYIPMMNMVQKVDFTRLREVEGDFSSQGGSQFGASADPLSNVDADSLQYVGRETLDGELTYILEGGGPASNGELKGMSPFIPATTRMWISADDGLPRKTVFYNEEGGVMFSQKVESVILDEADDESLFQFVPPEGAQIMDMTDAMINMQKSMQNPPEPAQ